MTLSKLFHVTFNGGSIHCIEGLSGRILRACSANQCTYTDNLHSAKSYLDFMEDKNIQILTSGRNNDNVSFQRKTTLKWNSDGSLSSLDMARILSCLDKKNLTECELTCSWENILEKDN